MGVLQNLGLIGKAAHLATHSGATSDEAVVRYCYACK